MRDIQHRFGMRASACTLLLLALAAAALAAEPWKDKPYQQWDQKDIQKILSDSPWVKQTVVNASWALPNAPLNAPTGNRPAGVGNPGGEQAAGVGGPPGERGGEGAPGSEMPGVREAAFYVRWVSSRTLRRALIRLQVLNGRLEPAQAENFLKQTPNTYQLVLFGQDLTPFAQTEEKALANNVWLELKSAHQKIFPSHVQLERAENGRLLGVLFEFPRTTNGQPTIDTTEKEVDLVCKLASVSLKFHFDPRRMNDTEGPDL